MSNLTDVWLRTDPLLARKKLESAARIHWLHWCIVAGSLLVTFFAWYYSASVLQARVKTQFDREADQVVELISERMRKYEDALRAGVALINASDEEVDYEHWRRYAAGMEIETTYPGINGIGVIHAVSDHALPDYLARQRRDRPEFEIHPFRRGAEYLPISYITPYEGNEAAVGLDMAHETNRFTAAMRARDEGTSQITGPITLVQDSGKTPGFLFYVPFYEGGYAPTPAARHRRFAGMVYAPFVVKKLLAGTLQKEKRHVGIRIHDRDHLLYDELVATEDDFDPNPLYTRSVTVPMYGRAWSFDIWSANSFREASSDSQPLTILVGGIVIDTLLIILFVMMSRSSRQALAYADSMTHQLERNAVELESKAAELQASNDSLSRFNESARGRELRMLELKQDINALLEELGQPPRYRVSREVLDPSPLPACSE